MESQLQKTGRTSQPYDGDISTRSANESELETDVEMEVIIDDGDTDEDCNVHAETNNIQHIQEQSKENGEDSVDKPHVGMIFDSAEDAYEFYDRYARKMGFSVRRGSSSRSRKNDVIIWRKYLCYREGWNHDKNDKPEETRVKNRPETRVGCQACLVVKLQVGDGTWVVTLFREKHNHNFEAPKKRRSRRSERTINGSKEGLSHRMRKAAVKTNFVLNLSEEADGSRNVGLVDKERTSQSYEGEIYADSANESGHETDDEIEVIIEDGDSDGECNVQGDKKILQGQRQNKVEDNLEKPRVGMLFDSAEEAHQFYKRYAREIGFRVRKGTSSRSRKNDDVIWRRFLCYREGRRSENKNKAEVKHSRETRIGCPAHLVVKLGAEDGTWIVSAFTEKHNHDFVKRDLLRSDRKIDRSPGDSIHSIIGANIKTVLKMNGLSEEAAGSRSDDSIDRDNQDDVCFVRKVELKKEDTEALLQYFKAIQDGNPNFFYAFQLDSNQQLTSLFWSDAISRKDYYCFGDVVCMDATYGTDKYGIPFIPLFGVNHHLQSTYFGGALILKETEASYVWLLETWMSAMKGSHPKTILTDQNSATSKAIAHVLPRTRHLYCLWHIFQNAKKHLRHLFEQNCSFAEDFSSCIYTNETIQEYEEGWESLLAKHSLHGNEWMASLYANRQQWVPVFSKDAFRADMTTLHRGDSINKFFGDYLNREMLYQEFVRAVDKSLVHQREEELKADYHDNHVLPCLKVHVPIEEDMGKIYTKSIFEQLQYEILLSLRFMAEKMGQDGTTSTFRCWLQNKEYIVNLCLNDFSCLCSCQKFEYTGILCSHILKVYHVTSVVKIPSQYILKRWTRYAKCGLAVNEEGGQMQVDCQIPYLVRHSSLCHQGMTIAAKGASSMEVYKVAKHWLEKALMEVENALKRESFGFVGNNRNDATMVSSVDGSKNQVLIRDPPNVKNTRGSPVVRTSIKEQKKRHKTNPSMASKEKESHVQDITKSAREKGSNDRAMTVEAPSNQQ